MRTYLNRVSQGVALIVALLGSSLVAQAAPTVSLTSPTSGTVAVNPPGSFTLTASASDANGIAKVVFYNGTSLIATDTTSPYSVSWSNVAKGSYSLTAKATSTDGSSTTSAPVTVIVNAKPTVSITTTQGVFPPGSVPLTATAADSDGTVSQVAFYADGTLIGTDTSSPYAFTWATVPTGVYMITAQATDNRGAVTTSATMPIVVGVAPTVTLTAPIANQSYGAPATVNLSATAVANGGATLGGVKFYQGTTLIATGTETTSGVYTATWSNVPVGSYSIKADAYDSSSLHTTSPAVPITVTATTGPQVYYIQTDHLDTPRLITTSSNTPVWRNLPTSEPFGNTPPEDDPQATGNHFRFNLRFPGQYADKETNTNYNTFRDYDPQTGRYIQSDPIGLNGGQFSTYTYVNGNPLDYVDPNGLWASQYGAYIHQRAGYVVFGDQITQDQLAIVARGHEWADSPEHQSADFTFMHAMRRPGQSVAQACEQTNLFISLVASQAIAARRSGDMKGSLFLFAVALHTMQDSTSPSHRGFQEWTGHESGMQVEEHVRAEVMYPGRGSELDQITRQAWAGFKAGDVNGFKVGCSCR